MTGAMAEAFEKIQNLEGTTKNHDRDAKSSKTSNQTRPEDEKVAKEKNKEINIVKEAGSNSNNLQKPSADPTETTNNQNSTEPSLENPKVGNPVSHRQVIDLWKQLKASKISPCSLDIFLRGARVYIPPPPPKPEPVSIVRQQFIFLVQSANFHPPRHQNTKPSWHVSVVKKNSEPTNA